VYTNTPHILCHSPFPPPLSLGNGILNIGCHLGVWHCTYASPWGGSLSLWHARALSVRGTESELAPPATLYAASSPTSISASSNVSRLHILPNAVGRFTHSPEAILGTPPLSLEIRMSKHSCLPIGRTSCSRRRRDSRLSHQCLRTVMLCRAPKVSRLTSCSADSSSWKCSSQRTLPFQHTTWHYTPEDDDYAVFVNHDGNE
jgi:hypothetical protein